LARAARDSRVQAVAGPEDPVAVLRSLAARAVPAGPVDQAVAVDRAADRAVAVAPAGPVVPEDPVAREDLADFLAVLAGRGEGAAAEARRAVEQLTPRKSPK
jgi:hypothetical protein